MKGKSTERICALPIVVRENVSDSLGASLYVICNGFYLPECTKPSCELFYEKCNVSNLCF